MFWNHPAPSGGWRAAALRGAAAFVVAVCALSHGSTPVMAQEPHELPFSVRDAMALAREHHPALAAAGGRHLAESGMAWQEAALPNPVLEWEREGIGGPVEADRFLTVSQSLGLTGRRLALRSAARQVDARAMADSVTVIRHIEASAAAAYWRASLARALLDVTVAQREDAEQLARVEADRAREGAVAELVALRASLELERARLAEATARAEFSRATVNLTRAVGVDSLPPVPPLDPQPPRTTAIPTLEVALEAALERRSDLAALRAGAQVARHRQSAERRATLPDVSLQAGTMRSAGVDMHTLGVSVPLPLFDRNSGGRKRAAGEVAEANAELDAAERSARAEVRAAVEALDALLAARSPGSDSLAARAAEVAEIADAAYAAGGGSLLELLDARRARVEAFTTALQWAAELRLALLELDRATGAPLLESLETP